MNKEASASSQMFMIPMFNMMMMHT